MPIISIFRTGVFESGDLARHITKEIVFYESLSQGNFVPVWGGDLNATYGFPAFMFLYILPFYVMAVIHHVGFSFIMSAKLLLAGSFILSGIFMYLWLKKVLNELSAFVGGLFYLFAPYHLIDLHFRADIGEVLAFVFIPLILLASTNLIKTRKSRWVFIEAVSIAFLLISHPAISLVGIPAIFLYNLFTLRHYRGGVKQIMLQITTIVTGILLIAFYLIPLLYNLRYTYSHSLVMQPLTFVKFADLLYSRWAFGLLFQGHHGELSFLIGYAQIIILGLTLFLIFRNKFSKKHFFLLVPSLIIIVFTLIMMLEISKPLWYLIPFMKNFQFSYRLLGINIFAFSVLAAVTVNYIKRKWLIAILCLFVVLTTILNWGNRKNIPSISDNTLISNVPFDELQGGGLAQAVTIWSDPANSWASKVPKHHIEIINGDGKIKEVTRKINQHTYRVNALTALNTKENTLYFPQWKLYIDGKAKNINILTKSKPKGVISFSISKGEHVVELIFKDSQPAIIGKIISAVSFISLLIMTYFLKRTQAQKT